MATSRHPPQLAAVELSESSKPQDKYLTQETEQRRLLQEMKSRQTKSYVAVFIGMICISALGFIWLVVVDGFAATTATRLLQTFETRAQHFVQSQLRTPLR